MVDMLFLTYGRFGITARCFRSLAPTLLDREDMHWFILDNGSTDGTADWLLKLAQRYPEKVTINLQARNTGVAGGRAILLEQSTAETVIILDSDVEARRADWLDRLIQPLQDHPDVWLCGPGGYWVSRDWTHYDVPPKGYTGYVDVCSGFCQAWKRQAFEAGVTMDLKYNPRWHEDSDMSIDALSRGGKVWHTGDVGLFHIFAVTGDDGSSAWKQQYLASKWRGKGLVRYEREERAGV